MKVNLHIIIIEVVMDFCIITELVMSSLKVQCRSFVDVPPCFTKY